MKTLIEIVSWCEEHNCPIVEVQKYICLHSLKQAIKNLDRKPKSREDSHTDF